MEDGNNTIFAFDPSSDAAKEFKNSRRGEWTSDIPKYKVFLQMMQMPTSLTLLASTPRWG